MAGLCLGSGFVATVLDLADDVGGQVLDAGALGGGFEDGEDEVVVVGVAEFAGDALADSVLAKTFEAEFVKRFIISCLADAAERVPLGYGRLNLAGFRVRGKSGLREVHRWCTSDAALVGLRCTSGAPRMLFL